MKTTKTKGFINIGGVPYLKKTYYGRHLVYLLRTMPNEQIEIKYIHNDKTEIIPIDNSDLVLREFTN